MANRSLKAEAKSGNGDHLTVHTQDTDALILPVAQLEALQRFRPDLIDIVVQETRAEAAHRRTQDSKVNFYIFVERVLGQLLAIVLAGFGILGGGYVGLNGEPWLGGTIVTVTVGTLAVTMLKRNQKGK